MEFVVSIVTSSLFISIVSAVLIFVLNEWIKQIWLYPLGEFKKIKQKVAFILTLHANKYSNPLYIHDKNTTPERIEEYNKISVDIRKTASELRAFVETIYVIRLFIPSDKDILEASQEMIYLSNALFSDPSNVRSLVIDNLEAVKTIRTCLKIKSGIIKN